jgi:hypothetical protein
MLKGSRGLALPTHHLIVHKTLSQRAGDFLFVFDDEDTQCALWSLEHQIS